MDRWSIVSALNYLPNEIEEKIVLAKVPTLLENEKLINQMVSLAELTRNGFIAGDLSTVMSQEL